MRPQLLLIPACLFCVMPADADEMPNRKAGLWEIKMVVDGRQIPLRNVQQCTDAETDALMASNLTGVMGSKCGKPAISNSGGVIIVDATCKTGSKSTATRAIITGDLDSAYTVAVTSAPAEGGSPPSAGADEPRITMQAKWIGPCKDGQQPGDVILPGGIRINVRRLGVEPGAPKRP